MAELNEIRNLVEGLKADNEQLKQRLGVQEDIQAIRRLQYTYGYYIDKCLYEQVVDLYHPTQGAVMFHRALWKGREGVSRLYVGRFRQNFTGDRNGPIKGFLLDHLQLQDIVTVAPDRLTAKMRSRTLMQAGKHEGQPSLKGGALDNIPEQWWEAGIYENEYCRDSLDSPWMIKLLNYCDLWQANYDQGWAKTPKHLMADFTKTYPEDPLGPDSIGQGEQAVFSWPDTHGVPFHYDHPITGKAVPKESLRAPTMEDWLASQKK